MALPAGVPALRRRKLHARRVDVEGGHDGIAVASAVDGGNGPEGLDGASGSDGGGGTGDYATSALGDSNEPIDADAGTSGAAEHTSLDQDDEGLDKRELFSVDLITLNALCSSV